MGRIKGRNTRPEKLVRGLLHGMGYRFRVHINHLIGKPDIVMPRHGKIVLVHGCFWHGHKKCKRSLLPASNVEFWTKKIMGNIKRDLKVKRNLRANGWKILEIWQCQTRDKDKLIKRLEKFMTRNGRKNDECA